MKLDLKPLLDMLLALILGICKFIGILFIPFIIMFLFWFAFYYIKGKRRKKPKYRKKYKKPSFFMLIVQFFKKLFVDFPRRVVLDWYNANPDAFTEYGIHIIAGEQGSGKSIAAAELILRLRKQYPACKLYTNIDFTDQDGKVTSPDDFIMRNNGDLGMIVFLDEIQNWFSSMESKDFPVDCLEDITQQRKQKKIFIGTSQVFTRVSKPIREQTTFLYNPLTIAGAMTIVRVYKAKLDDAGTVKNERLRKVYFFVHTDEIRNAYDTYERVQRLMKAGYKPKSEQEFRDVNFNISDINI